uniref:Putative receptor for egg jelly protein n=1 Tax=Rhipicephalus pulchellus TaxID=72859 RepID=L7LXS9_RHIPC
MARRTAMATCVASVTARRMRRTHSSRLATAQAAYATCTRLAFSSGSSRQTLGAASCASSTSSCTQRLSLSESGKSWRCLRWSSARCCAPSHSTLWPSHAWFGRCTCSSTGRQRKCARATWTGPSGPSSSWSPSASPGASSSCTSSARCTCSYFAAGGPSTGSSTSKTRPCRTRVLRCLRPPTCRHQSRSRAQLPPSGRRPPTPVRRFTTAPPRSPWPRTPALTLPGLTSLAPPVERCSPLVSL